MNEQDTNEKSKSAQQSRAGEGEYLPASPAEPGGRCRKTTGASFSPVAEEAATRPPI